MIRALLQVLSAILVIAVYVVAIKGLTFWFDSNHGDPQQTKGGQESGGRPPHIVFILADDLGYNDIQYHAYDHGSAVKTPALDWLASEGVKLENYYVQPECSPSRTQLLSGRYQIHTGLQHSEIFPPVANGLPLDEVTLPELLRASGYVTRMIGKWNIGYYAEKLLPTERGFDEFFGYLNEAEDYFLHNISMNVYGHEYNGYDFIHDKEPQFQYVGQYSTTVFTEKAEELILTHDQTKPLFLYMSHQAPHGPLQVPPQYTEQFANITDEDRRIYLGMVACLDQGVMNITDALMKSGMYNDTVIIFSTDNGGGTATGGNNWPLRGNKSTMWEGGIRGVGFVHSPLLNDSVKGTINRELIHVSDWLPTLVAGIGGGSLNGTKPLDGFDVWDTIRNGAPSPRKELLINIDPLSVAPHGFTWTQPSKALGGWTCELNDNLASVPYFENFDSRMEGGIRVGDWKMKTGLAEDGDWIPPPESDLPFITPTNYPNQTVWLFNITADPLEKHDLSLERPDVVAELLDRLKYYYHDMNPVRFPAPSIAANPARHGGVWRPWQ